MTENLIQNTVSEFHCISSTAVIQLRFLHNRNTTLPMKNRPSSGQYVRCTLFGINPGIQNLLNE